MEKYVEVTNLNPGAEFMICGERYVVLDKFPDRNGVLCVRYDTLHDNDMPFGATNNLSESPILTKLNKQYLQDCFPETSVLRYMTDVDLKETNGGREYGYCTCRVGLLTLEQYIKYAEYIPIIRHSWWLATPVATHNGGRAFSNINREHCVWCVSDCGYPYAEDISKICGARPVIELWSAAGATIICDEPKDDANALPNSELLKKINSSDDAAAGRVVKAIVRRLMNYDDEEDW
jgi:hypothetical protein